MTRTGIRFALARLSAAIVLGDWDELAAIRRAAPPGQPDRRWREAVLQSVLFAGYPRVVEACAVLEAAGGLGEPAADEWGAGDAGDDPGVGASLFERIYEGAAPRVREELARRLPLLEHWIVSHAYGRVLARDGLAVRDRELCAVAALCALDQPRQLASHAKGALRCGASAAEVRAALDAVEGLVPPAPLERAREVAARVTAPYSS